MVHFCSETSCGLLQAPKWIAFWPANPVVIEKPRGVRRGVGRDAVFRGCVDPN